LSEPARLRAQAEAAEARFQALVESAPDAIVTVNRAGLIVLVNSQAETLFGYARADLEGQPIELRVPERYHEQHAADRQRYTAAPVPDPWAPVSRSRRGGRTVASSRSRSASAPSAQTMTCSSRALSAT
jgi:PAS domain S-box-containing protein